MDRLRLFIMVGVLFMLPVKLWSQSNPEGENGGKRRPVQVSFFYPLCTNGFEASNYANNVSISFIEGRSRSVNGLALAGCVNTVKEDGRGLLMSGLLNAVHGTMSGVQLAGLVNIAGAASRGIQLAGLVNVARDFSGLQLAGLVNVAHTVRGVQLAGLVNVADSSDFPIGFINLIKNGEMGIALSYNELGTTMLSFQSGGRYTYGILGIGYNHYLHGQQPFIVSGGLGAHIPCTNWLRLNCELKSANLLPIKPSLDRLMVLNFSLLPAFRLLPHLELFGGPSISFASVDHDYRNVLPSYSLWRRIDATRTRQLHLGFQAGVQYII
ncbi:MAG: hypothetical protein ACFNYD_08025 [Bacteroides sp.]